jgi:hypothetical protein
MSGRSAPRATMEKKITLLIIKSIGTGVEVASGGPEICITPSRTTAADKPNITCDLPSIRRGSSRTNCFSLLIVGVFRTNIKRRT